MSGFVCFESHRRPLFKVGSEKTLKFLLIGGATREVLTPSLVLAKEDLRMTKFLQLHKCISLINLYWRSLKGYRWNWNSLTKRQTIISTSIGILQHSLKEKELNTFLVACKAEQKFSLSHPKILADQLTLFNHEWDRFCPPQIPNYPTGFSDLPTALRIAFKGNFFLKEDICMK